MAKYITCPLLGLIAKSVHPITGSWSVVVVQEVPPLVDFQNPPEGAPTYIILELTGSNRTKFNLPAPPPPVGTEEGPTKDQLP